VSSDDPFAPPVPGTTPPPPPPPDWGAQQQWGAPPPWGQPQWGQPQWGYQQPPAGTTNGLAIASLVTGLLPLPPVAIGTGIGALVQINKRGQSGRGMAVAGIVLGGLWALLITGFLVAGFSGAFDTEALGRVSQAGSTTVGSCLVDPGEQDGVWRVTDCSQPHDAELYLAEELSVPDWPGSGDLSTTADDLCMAAFKGYVGEGYYSSDYDYGFFVPDRGEWDEGEHRVLCAVLGYDGSLRGSVRS
jgi:hypothetical protein